MIINEKEVLLKNGSKVVLRNPVIEDAEAMIALVKKADTESKFLAREPGEFNPSIEREREIIRNVLDDADSAWCIAEYNGQVVGQCSVGLIRSYQRYRHRAGVAFVILKDYWNLGIGGKLMQQCIEWAHMKKVEKLELEVVSDNSRALHMYESFGFKIAGTNHKGLKYADGSYADEYFMELVL
jgi:RimJ/RimL family protein N-acetyltransferase